MIVAILLGSIKVPYEEIKRRVLELDEEKLTVAMIEQLIKYMPPPDQMKKLAELKDDYKDLAESEQFAVQVRQKSMKTSEVIEFMKACLKNSFTNSFVRKFLCIVKAKENYSLENILPGNVIARENI